ncbi:MAG: ketopantoate reductase C-terminal domain-containing protein, partial [Burkholderiales bacterium]
FVVRVSQEIVLELSQEIVLELWSKWVFLASLAGGTCLMRASVGDILAAPYGTDLQQGLIDECNSIATAEGFPVSVPSIQQTRRMLAEACSPLTSSMLRDMERNGPIEADHILGDLLLRANRSSNSGEGFPFLRLAYAHVKAYELRRARTLSL